MPAAHRLQHDFLWDLVGACFHHEDGIFRPGQPEVHLASLHFGAGGVEHELAVDVPDSDRPNRAAERHVRDGECG